MNKTHVTILLPLNAYEPIKEVTAYANSRKGGHGNSDTNTPVFNLLTSTGFLIGNSLSFILFQLFPVGYEFLVVIPKTCTAIVDKHLFDFGFSLAYLFEFKEAFHVTVFCFLFDFF